MRCPSLLLVRAVELRDSMLYVLGGAPETWTVATAQGPLGLALAMTFELDLLELDVEHQLFVVLEDEAGELGRNGLSIRASRSDRSAYVTGAPVIVNVSGRIDSPIRRLGGHTLRVLNRDVELAQTSFGVGLVV